MSSNECQIVKKMRNNFDKNPTWNDVVYHSHERSDLSLRIRSICPLGGMACSLVEVLLSDIGYETFRWKTPRLLVYHIHFCKIKILNTLEKSLDISIV